MSRMKHVERRNRLLRFNTSASKLLHYYHEQIDFIRQNEDKTKCNFCCFYLSSAIREMRLIETLFIVYD